MKPALFYPQVYNLALFEDAIAAKCLLWNAADPSDKLAIKSLFIKELIEPYTEILLSHEEGWSWALSNKQYQTLSTIIEVHERFQGMPKIKEKYYEFLLEGTSNMIKTIESEQDEGKVIAAMVQYFEDQNKTLTLGLNKHR